MEIELYRAKSKRTGEEHILNENEHQLLIASGRQRHYIITKEKPVRQIKIIPSELIDPEIIKSEMTNKASQKSKKKKINE